MGAATPRWETIPPSRVEDRESDMKDEQIVVQLRSKMRTRAGTEVFVQPIDGTFLRLKDVELPDGERVHAMVVQTDMGKQDIDLSTVRVVEVRNGSHLVEGMAVGAAVDVLVIVLLVATHPFEMHLSGDFLGRM